MRSLFPINSIRHYELSLQAGFAAVTALALIGLYWGAFRPIQAETARLGAASQELQELIRNTSQISEARSELERKLEIKESDSAELLKRIPASARESDFLAQVCQLAGENDLEVADYHPGGVFQLKTHHEMEVKVSTRGGYEAICRFLHQSDGMPRLSRLVQMDISTQLDDERLLADLTYRISYSPLSTATAKQGETP